jgi:CDGSH-type Zn-finger protein
VSEAKMKGVDDQRIKVIKDGPFLVTGGIPLMDQTIAVDEDGVPCAWEEGKRYPQQKSYSLCRCGGSKNKPFCDGAHANTKFNAKENGRGDFTEKGTKRFKGPTLELIDIKPYCAMARFCHRGKGVWQLTTESDDPRSRSTAIEMAANCPAGRLIENDANSGKAIEPELEPSIGVVYDPKRKEEGPLWVRGGIQVEGADGFLYKRRNRVTLCRCGKSDIMPFCDSSHAPD